MQLIFKIKIHAWLLKICISMTFFNSSSDWMSSCLYQNKPMFYFYFPWSFFEVACFLEYPSTHQTIHPSTHPPTRSPMWPPYYPSLRSSIHLLIHPPIHLSISLPTIHSFMAGKFNFHSPPQVSPSLSLPVEQRDMGNTGLCYWRTHWWASSHVENQVPEGKDNSMNETVVRSYTEEHLSCVF